jgi:hypothetical protein
MAVSLPPITLNGQQFGRTCTLLVSNSAGKAVDLSPLRIKFAVKRSDTITPNVADIRVYNVDLDLAQFIKAEFTKVILQAGYESNYGVIFKGNIKQVILGRESATDTFIDIIAGDGDQAYNFAVVNTTLSKGSFQANQLTAAVQAMGSQGVTMGYTGILPPEQLPRGKVMYGNARKYLRNIADSTGFGWSIQDEQVQFIKQSSYLPGIAVVLTSKTGLIGTPQQTNEGVNCKCLINPMIKIAGRIWINNTSVQQYKINLSVPNSPANIPAPLNADGIYYVLVVEHVGDTRGQEWYSNLTTLNTDVTANPLNAITVGASNG